MFMSFLRGAVDNNLHFGVVQAHDCFFPRNRKNAIQIKCSGGWCSDAVHREQFISSDTQLHN